MSNPYLPPPTNREVAERTRPQSRVVTCCFLAWVVCAAVSPAYLLTVAFYISFLNSLIFGLFCAGFLLITILLAKPKMTDRVAKIGISLAILAFGFVVTFAQLRKSQNTIREQTAEQMIQRHFNEARKSREPSDAPKSPN